MNPIPFDVSLGQKKELETKRTANVAEEAYAFTRVTFYLL